MVGVKVEHPIQEASKHVADGAAGLVTVGALMEWLPPLAAIFTIAWTGIRIFEWAEDRWFRGKKKE